MNHTTIPFEQKLDKIYWDTPLSTIGWLKEGNVIYASSKGFMAGEKYKQGCIAMLEAIKTHRSKRILNNLIDMQVIPEEEQQWLNTAFLPVLFQHAPLHMASVHPVSIFAQLSLKKTKAGIPGSPITSQDFGDLEEAYTWLKAV